jgi:putative DNA primase/helicase
MIATSAFGALSLTVQGLADVRRTDTLTGPTSLFTLTIAESGERKSTVDNYFTREIRSYEQEQRKALHPKVKARKTEISVWNSKRKGLLQKIASETKQGNPTSEIEVQLAELDRKKPLPVKVPHLIRTDETPEHLAMVLRDEWPSGGIVSSEAGTVFGSHAMNPESIMRNLSQFNVLWDGGELQYGRVTRESFRLKDVRLSVSLQVQPAALKEFLNKHGTLARGNGFLARFLVTWPESTQGSRLMTDPPDNWPALSAFDLRVRELLNMPHKLIPKGGIELFLLRFTPKAQSEWRNCHDKVELQLKPGQPLNEIKDVASKAADNIARMATLMHVFQYGPNGAVGHESVAAAFHIVSWHINEARRFLGEFSLPEKFSKAVLLDDWLGQRCRNEGISEIHKREISQYGPNAVRLKKELDDALQVLEELHRVQLIKDGKRHFIKLNPALLRRA